ncbi:GumC family protein [Sphingobium phenoxybenzoativorans]|uniref:GumC family protein n=1 Tax=Sphingobium phenoxybenzoativorans TaxID=1592790 RepID=UPI0008728E23|nr:polysaccharide biosynthesis tyrosine autokinase [Sphingobium phenoxybenzoativorans]
MTFISGKPEIGITNSVPASESSSGLIDFGAAWLAFRRRWILFVIVAVIVMLLTVAAYILTPKQYTASAQVVLKTGKEQVVSQDIVQRDTPDTYAVDTAVEILQSPGLAAMVVTRLGLANNPDFMPPPSEDDGPLSPQEAVSTAVDLISSGLAAKRFGVAFVIDVSYTNKDPVIAAKVVNELVKVYTDDQLRSKLTATQQASGFLYGKLGGLREKAVKAESALADFKSSHPLLTSADDQNVSQQQFASMSSELSAARAEHASRLAELQKARALAAGGNYAPSDGFLGASDQGSPEGANGGGLWAQEAVLSRKLAELEANLGPNHPQLISTRSELTALRARIAAAGGRSIGDLEAKEKAAASRVASLESSVGNLSATLNANNRAKATQSELAREASTIASTYEDYLRRYRESTAQEGAQSADARILTLAGIPGMPSFPSLKSFGAIGIVLALTLGALAILVRELLEKGIRTSRDVEKVLGMRTLASVPSFSSTLSGDEKAGSAEFDPSIVIDRPFSAFTESFRMLLASLYKPQSTKPYQVVAVTSALPGEGKSTSTMCLARVAATSGLKTLLIDCDTRRPDRGPASQHAKYGLLEVLAGTCSLQQAIVKDPISSAYFLPISTQPVGADDVLIKSAMDDLLADLRKAFDFILIDTAPVLAIAETRLLVTKADSVVFLVRWGDTPSDASLAASRMLLESGANVAGIALTQVDLDQQNKWTKEDASAYYKKYKKYYAA